MIVTSVQIKTAKTQKHLYCLVFTKILIRKNGDFYFLPLTSSLLLQKMRLLSAKTDNSRKALYQTHFKCE